MRKRSSSKPAGLGLGRRQQQSASLSPASDGKRRRGLLRLYRAACEAQGVRRRRFRPSSRPGSVLQDPKEQVQGVLAPEMKQQGRGMVWKRLLAFSASALNLWAPMCAPRDSFTPGPQCVSTDRPCLEQTARNFLCNQGKL